MLALTLSLPFQQFSQKNLTVPPSILGVPLRTHPMRYKARPSTQIAVKNENMACDVVPLQKNCPCINTTCLKFDPR